MTLAYGMAVLFVRIFFVLLTYVALEKVDWRKLFSANNYRFAQYVCALSSIALGHLIGSFFITIMELLRDVLFSAFL
ncbi:DUF1146 domain-containing protein [Tuanshanicoccus lijuaniae]|uniref:DUF1146 family protein n=1 Tax=Aerococcaceae bacterium zg-1292 TaxID=2774330 RepID=UPI001938065F|nr:DUF1146 domain-containing protein [Aerococcaceae bacterium zg-1292]MBF6625751.1 DUF1146 domain-containing protein [Aerococcaceae bacterium zg-BR9]MBF6978676.1 DUF1146 domain-containing protein [Aerococcaceae bacterium zg-BR22]MBS4455661.1 DUF1146 family protein [Aerococcaceae bacterium zg-A91]MBS4457280.1 DUF1146 family protein [Aerococcaceae bacterium zg-BR33]